MPIDVTELGIIISRNSLQSLKAFSSIVNIVSTYMSPANIEMGENIYISEIKRQIQSLNGVISITDVAVFNKVGGEYSSNQTSMSYSNSNTKQISLVDDTLFAEPSQIYQVRFPNRDITVQVKNFQTVNFS